MRILVAEHDAPLADFLCQQLEKEQFSVRVVSDGLQAQRMASEQAFDFVVLDLGLPGAKSLDVLRGIRSKKPVCSSTAVLTPAVGDPSIAPMSTMAGAT